MNKIEINIKSFLAIVAFIFAGYLMYELRGIVISFFVAFIIFATLKPIVDLLESKKINRLLSILIVYLSAILVFIALILIIINGIVGQAIIISNNINLDQENIVRFVDQNVPFLREYLDVEGLANSIDSTFSIDTLRNVTTGEALSGILQNLSPFASTGISFITSFVGGLVSIFVVIMLSIYMVIPRKDFYEGILANLPKRYSSRLNIIIDKIRTKLGAWVIGQLILMLIVGILTYFAISLPGLFIEDYQLGKFALIIAIIAGILEALPNVGPFLTLIIAVMLAILTGASLGIIIYILIIFILIQQAEGIFIVPLVMRRAIDLNPILAIISVISGFQLGGPIGALLAVPVVGIFTILLSELLAIWRKNSNE